MLGRRQFLQETARGLLLVGLSPILSRCGDSTPAEDGMPGDPDGNFYFAVISDTHLLEEEDAKQNEVFALTVEILNTFSPTLDFVVATGDILDYLPSDDPAYYDENYAGLDMLLEISSGFRMPFHLVIGNHDYYTGGEVLHFLTKQKQEREQLYMGRAGMPGPYYAFEHHGMKFYCLNSMQNDPAVEWNPNAVGTFGPEQLACFGNGLGDGKPAFLFHHHPLATELTTTAGLSAFIPFEVPRADGLFRKYQGTPRRTTRIRSTNCSHRTGGRCGPVFSVTRTCS